MEIRFIISSIFEITFGGFIIWGIFNEDKLVAFEERLRRKPNKRNGRVRFRDTHTCNEKVA